MRIRIHTDKAHMTIPVPLGLAGTAIRLIPNTAFTAMQESVPKEFEHFVSRQAMLFYYQMCREIMEEYAGLEIVHVESHDHGFVSITL